MTELVEEDEIYERIMELEHLAKAFYVFSKTPHHVINGLKDDVKVWDDVIGMLSDDNREEYEELMVMWDEIQDDYVGDEEE